MSKDVLGFIDELQARGLYPVKIRLADGTYYELTELTQMAINRHSLVTQGAHGAQGAQKAQGAEPSQPQKPASAEDIKKARELEWFMSSG